MRKRCCNPKCKDYPDYGGRGISVDPRWERFENFAADMGPRPSPKHSLDRIDVNGNYSPENCRWATTKEQTRNKRNNIWITFNGKTMCLADWGKETGFGRGCLQMRMKLGWPVDKMLTVPPHKRKSLSPKDVALIKRMISAGNISCAKIGRLFGVQRSAISAIARGENHR